MENRVPLVWPASWSHSRRLKKGVLLSGLSGSVQIEEVECFAQSKMEYRGHLSAGGTSWFNPVVSQ